MQWGVKMNCTLRSCKSAAGLALAGLLAAMLVWAPTPALAEVGDVTGMDHWYLDKEADPSDPSIDVLAVTGAEGDHIWVDVAKNGTPIAKRLVYELNSTEADANGEFVGVLSLDIDDFKPEDTYTISAYADHDAPDDAALYTGTVKPVLARFGDKTVIAALRTVGESDADRPFELPKTVNYDGSAWNLTGTGEDGVATYELAENLPTQIEGKVKYLKLDDNSSLKEETFTITADEGSKLIPVDNVIEANGTYYRTLQLTGEVTAKYPGQTEFTIMCVELDGNWGENAKPYVANFRYVDATTYNEASPESSANLRDTDAALNGLLDKLIVTKDYAYTPPAYIYIKNGDTVEYWQLVTDAGNATYDSNGAVNLAPTKDGADQTIDIAYKKMAETYDAVWVITCVDATKGINEAGRVISQETRTVPSGGHDEYTVQQSLNGLVPVPGTDATYTYNYDSNDLIHRTTIYYGVEGENPTDSYNVTVRFVNIANNQVLRTTSVVITPDYVTQRRYLSVPLDESFVSGGNTYVRLNGQAAQIDHNYFNYDVVNGTKQKTYTVWYRDVNDDLHDTTTITTYTTVYDDVFVDRGITTVTNLGTTTVAGGTAAGGAAAGGAAAGGAATGGTATLTDNGGLTGITTGGGTTTLVRDDGTGVTTERIEEEANPLAAPTQGEGTEGTSTAQPAQSAGMSGLAALIIGAIAAIGAALAVYILLVKNKDQGGDANE